MSLEQEYTRFLKTRSSKRIRI